MLGLGEIRVKESHILAVLLFCSALGACNDIGRSRGEERSQTSVDFDYARDDATDEFSSTVKSVASASFPRKGLAIDVKFSCENNQKNPEKSRLNLTAVMVGNKDGNIVQGTGAILYKIDDRKPEVYKDDFFDGILPNGTIDMNLNRLGIFSGSLPEYLNIRFVLGASPAERMMGDIDQLSSLPKIDLKIPVRTSKVGKVVSDCLPS